MKTSLHNKSGDVLFSIAYENWANHTTGFMFLHATDRGDALAKILMSKNVFPKGCRIVNVAPAIGVMEKIKKQIRVFGGL